MGLTIVSYNNIAQLRELLNLFLFSTTLTLHYTTLHYTTLHYTTLHYTTLHYTTLHYTTLHYTTLHYTTLHYTTLHYTTLHYTTLHYTTLHYTTLHYTTLHYTTLHYTTLHYTTLSSIIINLCNSHHFFLIIGNKHDCDSPDGFCRNKCPFVNGSYPFWRVRNADTVPFLWTIKTMQMFESPNSRTPLNRDPTKAYASTFFGPGKWFENKSFVWICETNQFLF